MKKPVYWIVAFTVPCILLYLFIYGLPLITVFATSFTHYTVSSTPVFNGFENYKQLFIRNNEMLTAIGNTLLWVLLQSFICVPFGLLVALILFQKPFMWKFTRASYMVPNIIPTAATGLMFKMMLNPSIGVIKPIFDLLGNGKTVPNLFSDSRYAFIAITCTWIFYAAFYTIIILAEISAIPNDIFEAASIDGASEVHMQFHIIIPLIRHILMTCVILAATAMISQFDIIYIITKGGPGSTTTNLPILLYTTGFKNFNYGLANSIGVVQIIMGGGLVIFIRKIFRPLV